MTEQTERLIAEMEIEKKGGGDRLSAEGESELTLILHPWSEITPDPVDEFLHVLGLDVDFAGTDNICDQSFTPQEGGLQAAKHANRVVTRIAQGCKVIVVNDESFSCFQLVLIYRAERVDEDVAIANRLEHEQVLSEETFRESLPLGVDLNAYS